MLLVCDLDQVGDKLQQQAVPRQSPSIPHRAAPSMPEKPMSSHYPDRPKDRVQSDARSGVHGYVL